MGSNKNTHFALLRAGGALAFYAAAQSKMEEKP